MKLTWNGERRMPNKYGGFNELLRSCVMKRLRYVLPYVRMDQKVLNLGCGVGWTTKYLSLYCKSIYGLDNSKEAIEYAKRYNDAGNIDWVVSDMFELSRFKTSSVDLLVTTAAIEHITKQELGVMFSEVHRVLKPKAIMVGTCAGFRAKSKEFATEWHKYEPSIKDFKQIASSEFNVVKVSNFKIDTPELKKAVTEGYFILKAK